MKPVDYLSAGFFLARRAMITATHVDKTYYLNSRPEYIAPFVLRAARSEVLGITYDAETPVKEHKAARFYSNDYMEVYAVKMTIMVGMDMILISGGVTLTKEQNEMFPELTNKVVVKIGVFNSLNPKELNDYYDVAINRLESRMQEQSGVDIWENVTREWF
jgi:hypothetical protein